MAKSEEDESKEALRKYEVELQGHHDHGVENVHSLAKEILESMSGSTQVSKALDEFEK